MIKELILKQDSKITGNIIAKKSMQPIAESELIINSRGAIYHLDAKPGEIAENIITVGHPDRVKEVSKVFRQSGI